jgi:hypothetical protein
MAATIRPTLLLRMDLDEKQFSDERVAEIKRSYSYIASSSVSSHTTNLENPENTIRFLIRLQQPYWFSSEEGSDELWETVMLKWLKNMFYKVSNTLVAFNRSAQERKTGTLDFSWLELEFKDKLLAIRLEADSAIPSVALSLVEMARLLSNASPLAESSVSCLRIPSRASYDAQFKNASTKANEGDQTDATPDKSLDETEDVASETVGSASAKGVDETEEAPVTNTPQTPVEPVLFEIDFTVWGIEYDDGTVREFDSEAAVFRDECPMNRTEQASVQNVILESLSPRGGDTNTP